MEALLNDFGVDLSDQLHALLEVVLVVLLGTLRFDVLLDRVDLAFVGYQSLLLLVQPVVDVRRENLVLARVVLHRVVRRLLAQPTLVLANDGPDVHESLLLSVKLLLEHIGARELVLEFIFHLVDRLLVLLQLRLDRVLQMLVLVAVLPARLDFRLQLGRSALCIIEKPLLELKIIAHLINRLLGRKLLLTSERLVHVEKQSFDCLLGLFDLLVVALLLLLKLLHILVDLLLLLVEDLVLLEIFAAVLLLVLQVVVDVLDVALVSLDHPAHIRDFFLLLLDLSVVLLDAVHQSLAGLGEGQIHFIGL